MKLKKLTAIAATSALIVSCIAPTGVLANNYSDTAWTFSIATGGNAYASEGREKQDSTSAYMKCNTMTHNGGTTGSGNSYYGTAYGSTSLNGTYSNCMYNGKTSTRYLFTSGTVKYMTNYIKESNHSFARIWCESGYTSYATFTGVWSPDSI